VAADLAVCFTEVVFGLADLLLPRLTRVLINDLQNVQNNQIGQSHLAKTFMLSQPNNGHSVNIFSCISATAAKITDFLLGEITFICFHKRSLCFFQQTVMADWAIHVIHGSGNSHSVTQ
jgi:uncharacterized protein YjeT (DUF2065 family)